MTWVMVIALAAAVFALLVWLFKAPRPSWEAIGAALALGLVGFALQARPQVPGAPKAADEDRVQDGGGLIKLRLALLGKADSVAQNRWLITSDALARNGQFGAAASLALGAVERVPQDTEAWLALGMALSAHAGGKLTPAVRYAYDKAASTAPNSPAPPYLLGMSLIENEQYEEARQVLGLCLARSPAKAPWRRFLGVVIARLDLMMTYETRSGAPGPPKQPDRADPQ